MKDKLLIISGPSGVGKHAVISELLKEYDQLREVISYTDREPRKNEVPGDSYFFVYPAKFQDMIKNKKFLEWKIVHHHHFGTPIDQVKNIMDQDKCPLLEIDVKGAVDEVKKQIPKAFMIFINYENLDDLIKRLKKKRPNMSAAEIKTRLQTARIELKYLKYYDQVVINHENKLNETVAKISKIVYNYLNNKN